MQNKLFLKAADICELLEVKQTSAYLVRVPYIKNISQLCFANVKHFFTLLGKMFFTSYGKEFFIYHGKQIFTSQGKHLFTRYGKQTLSSAQPCG